MTARAPRLATHLAALASDDYSPLKTTTMKFAYSSATMFVLAVAQVVAAETPVHKKIDELVIAQAKGAPFAPVATDAEFARRVYLDLAGRIPSYQELRTFLDDKGADKRAKLVDTLLKSADYPRRMQELFSNMLLERRGDNAEWTKFLKASFEANKPWDQLAREIVDPDPDIEATRGAVFSHQAFGKGGRAGNRLSRADARRRSLILGHGPAMCSMP